MKTESVEEFLARGGKITKSKDNGLSLEELLKKEGVMSDDAKNLSDSLSSSISKGLSEELKPKKG